MSSLRGHEKCQRTRLSRGQEENCTRLVQQLSAPTSAVDDVSAESALDYLIFQHSGRSACEVRNIYPQDVP